MTDYHMLSASGSNPEDVNRSIGSKRGSLTKRLQDAGVSTDLKVEKQVFKISGTLKRGEPEEGDVDTFTRTSRLGWDEVTQNASNGRDLGQYQVVYGSDQYLALTEEQRKALEPPRTPAGIDHVDNDRYGLRRLL